MTEAEAREIVKNAMSKSYIEARLWEAKGFLAGIAHERARAERLVEAMKNLRLYYNSTMGLCHALRAKQAYWDRLIKQPSEMIDEALSAYNRERGEKEGKA